MAPSAIEAVLDRMHAVLGGYYAGAATREDLAAVLAPDVVWHVPGANAIAGDYHGVDEVIDYFTRRRDLAAGTFRMTPRETLTGHGEHVGVLTDGIATIGGTERRWSTLGLYRIGGNRIAECWLLPLDPAAFDDAWAFVNGSR
jgi:ketosteroid isomerase-like protein